MWKIVNAIQTGLRDNGFDLGKTKSPVTPVFLQGGVEEGTNLIVEMREKYHIFCSLVTYPVIPKGQLLIRIIQQQHTLWKMLNTPLNHLAK